MSIEVNPEKQTEIESFYKNWDYMALRYEWTEIIRVNSLRMKYQTSRLDLLKAINEALDFFIENIEWFYVVADNVSMTEEKKEREQYERLKEKFEK